MCSLANPGRPLTGKQKREYADTSIPPDRQESFFQSSKQPGSPTKRQFGGLGPGLVLGKGLADHRQGTIEAESPSHFNGTTGDPKSTLWFTIPLQVAGLPELPPETSQPGHQKVHCQQRLPILLVDDTEINQRPAGVILQKSGL